MENMITINSGSIFYMAIITELSKKITAEMESRNLGLREAARIIGVSHPTLGKALAGEQITFDFAIQLSKFLHMKPEQVFRLAGLLPPVSETTEQTERLLYLFDQLAPKDRQTVLDMIDFLLRK